MQGYITKGIGGFYYVKTAEGLAECKAKGIFRKRGLSPVAGDWVEVDENHTIASIRERKNHFIRPPIANLEVLFLVASTVQPAPSTLVLDRMIALAVSKQVQPVLVITKEDLSSGEKLAQIYEKTQVPVIRLDYDTGEGLEEVRSWIKGRLAAFSGNSGVGKSTLINHLVPQLERETGDISLKLGRGRHTTREVEIFEACEGRIADTPGFANLDLERVGYIDKEELQHCFTEFEPYFGKCKFTGCSHRKELGCLVRQAVEEGVIAPSRYESYLTMYEEASKVNEWERR